MMHCALALVLLLDSSGSVDGRAWQMQVDAHADAFADDRIAATMTAQGLSAVVVVAYDDAPRVLVPWRLVDTPDDAAALAREIAGVRRPSNGATHTGRAVAFSLRLLEQAPCGAEREIIDLVTDGPGDDDARLEDARDEATARGVKINVLAVDTYGARAADWARAVAVTPGGFVMEADGWQEVARALRRKIASEVARR
jgi:hypothetical protein